MVGIGHTVNVIKLGNEISAGCGTGQNRTDFSGPGREAYYSRRVCSNNQCLIMPLFSIGSEGMEDPPRPTCV